ncbi:hypothetical protein GCM10010303_79290 [Streptomyces purpurascens]|nr:hypothetical protein GCM10010303_79290 [Streptomyces purpurascens]
MVVATVLRRGEKALKVFVPVAPDCLTVETQAAADGAQGHAGGGQFIDFPVALADPVQKWRLRSNRLLIGVGVSGLS